MPPIEGDLELCYNGYHACRRDDLLCWIDARIFPMEYRGEIIEGDDKVVVREARLLPELKTWNERTARLFACDCAERVLKNFEDVCEDDGRVRKCINTARRFARGKATKEELSAARSAAWSAARSAARSVRMRTTGATYTHGYAL